MSKIRIKLWVNRKIFRVPKYSLNNIHDKFKDHVNNKFALLSSSEQRLKGQWVKTRDIITEELAKTNFVTKRIKKYWWMTEGTLKIPKDRQEAKVKGDKQN